MDPTCETSTLVVLIGYAKVGMLLLGYYYICIITRIPGFQDHYSAKHIIRNQLYVRNFRFLVNILIALILLLEHV